MFIFPYLLKNIFDVYKIFNKQCHSTVGSGFGDIKTIKTISFRKVNRMATALNTIIDFCSNICINDLN